MPNITGFAKVAKYLTPPLVLVGFVLMLVFGTHKQLIKSGLLTQVSQEQSGMIITIILQHGFILGLLSIIAGVIFHLLGKMGK